MIYFINFFKKKIFFNQKKCFFSFISEIKPFRKNIRNIFIIFRNLFFYLIY